MYNFDILQVVADQAGSKARFKGQGSPKPARGPGRTKLGRELADEEAYRTKGILEGESGMPSGLSSLIDRQLGRGITTAGTDARRALTNRITRLSGEESSREGNFLLAQHDRGIQRSLAGVEENRRFQKTAEREGAVEQGMGQIMFGRQVGYQGQQIQQQGLDAVENVRATRGDLSSNVAGGAASYITDLMVARKYSEEFSPQGRTA